MEENKNQTEEQKEETKAERTILSKAERTIWAYFVIGLAVAFGGVLFSDVCGNFFNGMDYGAACTVGMGIYLCVVVITCTGIIVSHLEKKK